MKKRLNSSQVVNELTGQSAFFKQPATNEVVFESEPPSEPTASTPPVRAVRDVREVRAVRDERDLPEKRVMKRHPFEIYRDQLEALQEMKLRKMMEGQLKSMSEMVRDALDEYIRNNRT